MVVQTIAKVPWNSIDEMNTLDTGAFMQGNFTVLFMSFMAFRKFLLPFGKYTESILASKDSDPSNGTSVEIEIEKPPPKYSANKRSIAITGSRRLKNCFSISQANMKRI